MNINSINIPISSNFAKDFVECINSNAPNRFKIIASRLFLENSCLNIFSEFIEDEGDLKRFKSSEGIGLNGRKEILMKYVSPKEFTDFYQAFDLIQGNGNKAAHDVSYIFSDDLTSDIINKTLNIFNDCLYIEFSKTSLISFKRATILSTLFPDTRVNIYSRFCNYFPHNVFCRFAYNLVKLERILNKNSKYNGFSIIENLLENNNIFVDLFRKKINKSKQANQLVYDDNVNLGISLALQKGFLSIIKNLNNSSDNSSLNEKDFFLKFPNLSYENIHKEIFLSFQCIEKLLFSLVKDRKIDKCNDLLDQLTFYTNSPLLNYELYFNEIIKQWINYTKKHIVDLNDRQENNLLPIPKMMSHCKYNFQEVVNSLSSEEYQYNKRLINICTNLFDGYGEEYQRDISENRKLKNYNNEYNKEPFY